MRRVLVVALIGIVVLAVAVLVLRREAPAPPPEPDAELQQMGQFLSDSLGVGLLLPESPGWTFVRPPLVPGGPYITAQHESHSASVRLYVLDRAAADSIGAVVRRRRDALAGFFHVREIDEVIEEVLREASQPMKNYAAYQWQAVTEPVAVAEQEQPARVLFFYVVVEHPERYFEALGVLSVPIGPESDPSVGDQLMQDISYVMQSLVIR
ncbi:MAG: hypothetical protein JSW67_03365 [Candidatus Latescibacterota bacterium]|nr:MAG: hypothetical protein JSW67_03365 [Candidatus Latescibacterota bacterium]